MPLRRELGLRDLTLFSIACIVGTRWIASAAHAGPGSLLLWALSAVLFLIPLSIASAVLTVKHPEAGGLYRWTRADFGPWHGFLAFWIYWLGIAFWFPSAAMFYASIVLSPLGLAENRGALLVTALLMIWIAMGTNIAGLRIGKWTENAGAAAAWVLMVLLVIAAAIVRGKRGTATTFHLLPAANWDTVSLWATVAYAMTGIEMAGFMGAEIRNPVRDMPRAAWISALFTTAFYVCATAALLVIMQPGQISELSGVVDVMSSAGALMHLSWFAPVTVLLVMVTAIGQFGGLGSSVSRMPFAAGVDHLLPPAFARVHSKWNTPYVAMFAFALLASAMLVLAQLGDSLRAAYQTLVSLMVIGGFLPYVYMFASAWREGSKVSAFLGQAMTALAVAAAVVPTDQIGSVWLFEFKLAAGTAGVVAAGWLVYRRYAGTLRSAQLAESVK